MRPREGSRKAQVYDVFVSQGADQAEVMGLSLGLAPGTLSSWFGGWAKAGTTPAKANPIHEQVNGHPFCRRQRVFDIGSPKRLGTVINTGVEVSEVRWDTGIQEYVTNDYLRKAE